MIEFIRSLFKTNWSALVKFSYLLAPFNKKRGLKTNTLHSEIPGPYSPPSTRHDEKKSGSTVTCFTLLYMNSNLSTLLCMLFEEGPNRAQDCEIWVPWILLEARRWLNPQSSTKFTSLQWKVKLKGHKTNDKLANLTSYKYCAKSYIYYYIPPKSYIYYCWC